MGESDQMKASGLQPEEVAANPVEEIASQVNSIKEKMGARTEVVKKWCEERHEVSSMSATEGLKRLNELKERLKILREKRDEFESQGYANEKKLKSETTRINTLRERLDKLKSQNSKVEEEYQSANRLKSKAEAEVEQVKKTKELEEDSYNHRVTHMTQGARLYRKLGLVFTPLGQNKVCLTFTQIDSKDPGKEFVVIFSLDPDGRYIVNDVKPPVEGMKELVDKLNVDNDFAYFTQYIRQHFVKLAT